MRKSVVTEGVRVEGGRRIMDEVGAWTRAVTPGAQGCELTERVWSVRQCYIGGGKGLALRASDWGTIFRGDRPASSSSSNNC